VDASVVIVPLMMVVVAAIYGGILAAILWCLITRELQALRRQSAIHAMLQTFGEGQAAVLSDPRQLLAWYPLARAARQLEPAAFAAIDAATGRSFPFTRDDAEQAHAKISSDWLAWEKAHDEEYRIKAADAEQVLRASTGDAAAVARARLDRIQHEKIERYQQRYEEYIRTGRALQALLQ
jgi:hypothetical protein